MRAKRSDLPTGYPRRPFGTVSDVPRNPSVRKPQPPNVLIPAVKTGLSILSGDKVSTAYHVYKTLSALKGLTSKPSTAAAMPRRRGRRRGRRRNRRGGRVPASMRPISLPFRRVITYERSYGSWHRWYYTVNLKLLIAGFGQSYGEFKPMRMSVRYIPNNPSNETGLYTAVLLDQAGFGDYGPSTAVDWFPYIASMPGAVVKPRHEQSIFRWAPTEPSSKEWRVADQDYSVATLYICNNGKESTELGGMIVISGTLSVRGRYKSAPIKVDGVLRLPDWARELYPPPEDAVTEGFDMLQT